MAGVWGQSPQWGFRGGSPLPLIVLKNIKSLKNIILRKLFFVANPPALIVLKILWENPPASYCPNKRSGTAPVVQIKDYKIA